MRIGVLEWATCGGSASPADLPDSIRKEGWAMHQAVIHSLSCGIGFQPVSVSIGDQPVSASRSTWLTTYRPCETTIVIAPECDNTLVDLLQWFDDQGMSTCNCDQQFTTAATDKWQTAQLLTARGLPHPPTWLLSEFEHSEAKSLGWHDWVIKPRDGVGCDGIQRVTTGNLFAAIAAQTENADRWLVQPWLGGQAYSRAAIIDQTGQCHWLPVTRQRLAIDSTVKYLGGAIEPNFHRDFEIKKILTRAIATLPGRPRGWVGIDFVWDDTNDAQPLTIIEINPRMTTSFIGLARCQPSLAALMVQACSGEKIEVPQDWGQLEFDA